MTVFLTGLIVLLAAAVHLSAETSEPLPVGGAVTAPVRTFAPAPRYPELALKAGVTGVVIVKAVIDEGGEVEAAEILKGLPMGLNQVALDAVKRWKFEPATLDGKPVRVSHSVTFSFKTEDRNFKLVANADVAASALSTKEISNIFLKKMTVWDSGLEISPVDLAVDNPVREAFSREIHGKGAGPVNRRWERLIFSGAAVPPPNVESDIQVLDFVRRTAGGVGYVSASASLPEGVKLLDISS